MTVNLTGTTIRLEDACRVEDAEPLAALLHDAPERTIDVSGCESLHGAVLQVLLAFRPDVNGEAAEASLAKWLPLLLRTDETVAKATPGRQR